MKKLKTLNKKTTLKKLLAQWKKLGGIK